MNEDLRREREKAAVSVEKLTHMFDGGAERTARRRQIEAIIARDPTGIFSNQENAYLHRTDRHVRSLAKHVRMVELCRKLGIGDECGGDILESKDFYTILNALADDLPTALHWVMFVPNIKSLCDEQQQKEWLALCRDWRMIGCYAQTEIGHGSNVRALETTATFLAESKGGLPGGSFVINSPTLTSGKFWPGTLGRTGNHAMVMARLIDGQGVDRGVHNFLVPIRSLKDHSLLPGIETGDIGPKIGYNVMDNGYAFFRNVQIPRRNMAMRFSTVDENGVYRRKTESDAAAKVVYITMMQVRAYICNEASKNLAQACTIAIRYSAVRRQGYAQDGETEIQILDYRQQQHRLLPMLAASYCFFFTGKRVLEKLREIETKLVQGKAATKQQVTDLHASSSGLKAYTTTVAANGMEDCRKACGGHGFLQCSGLPELVTTYLQSPTVEGDNHMLPQQVVKVLLKLVHAVKSNEDLSGYTGCDSFDLVPSMESIINKKEPERCAARDPQSLREETAIHYLAYRHRAARLLVQVAKQLDKVVSSGQKSFTDAWNDSLIEMARVSRAYSQFLLLRNFVQGIESEQSSGANIGSEEAEAMLDLARLLALFWMEGELGDFLEDGYITEEQASWVRWGVLDMLDRVRPNAVALVDARDFSDFRLKSALGRFDGDVYPAILEAAKKDPLNKEDIGPGYQEHLRRLIVDGVGVYTQSRL